jgi:IS1 family transposase
MKDYAIRLICLTLFFPLMVFFQEAAVRYSSVDSFAATVKYRGNLASLTQELQKIRTDKLTHYQRLIPKDRHRSGAYCINAIERMNLSIRTDVKRLSRRFALLGAWSYWKVV